jgi:hypothetical protein
MGLNRGQYEAWRGGAAVAAPPPNGPRMVFVNGGVGARGNLRGARLATLPAHKENAGASGVAMSATFTASDWLRRAAEFWAEADAADDLHRKRLKIMLAQGCERIAHHVAAQK